MSVISRRHPDASANPLGGMRFEKRRRLPAYLPFTSWQRRIQEVKRRKKLERLMEYQKLKDLLPSLSHRNKVSKVEVIEEAISYIDQLQNSLASRIRDEQQDPPSGSAALNRHSSRRTLTSSGHSSPDSSDAEDSRFDNHCQRIPSPSQSSSSPKFKADSPSYLSRLQTRRLIHKWVLQRKKSQALAPSESTASTASSSTVASNNGSSANRSS